MTPRKLTRNQQLVLDRLAASPAALTAYDLLDQLRPAGLRAPVQVYRALETLGQRGLIHRIESLNAYVACCGHEHQLPPALRSATTAAKSRSSPYPPAKAASRPAT